MTQATEVPAKRAHKAITNEGGGTQLLDKALNIVELVAHSNQRLTAHDIAVELDYTKPTTYRILAALVRRGMLSLDNRDQAYELGLRFAELTTSLRSSHHFLMLIEKDLINLSARTGENVTVGIAEKDSVRIVSRYSVGYEVKMGASSGSKRPYHASGIGKVALAFLSPEEGRQAIKRIHFQSLTPKTLPNAEALEEELRLVRARGYAIDDEEIIEGVRCVARPLLSREGQLIGAISLSAPAYRMPPRRVRDIAFALGKITAALSERLSASALPLDSPSSRIGCLHEGGFFHPLAIGLRGEHLMVLDGMAPALHIFTPNGVPVETHNLPFVPSASAISPSGRLVLAHGQEWYDWSTTGLEWRGKLNALITALAFDGETLYLIQGGDSPCLRAAETNDGNFIALEWAPTLMSCHHGRAALSHPYSPQVDLLSLGDGELLQRIEEDASIGELCGLLLHESCLYTTGAHARYIRRLDLTSYQQEYLVAPECHITALGRIGQHIFFAGANLDAVLDDENTQTPGSLYRLLTDD